MSVCETSGKGPHKHESGYGVSGIGIRHLGICEVNKGLVSPETNDSSDRNNTRGVCGVSIQGAGIEMRKNAVVSGSGDDVVATAVKTLPDNMSGKAKVDRKNPALAGDLPSQAFHRRGEGAENVVLENTVSTYNFDYLKADRKSCSEINVSIYQTNAWTASNNMAPTTSRPRKK